MDHPFEMNAVMTKQPVTQGAERRTARREALNVEVGFRSDTNFYTGFTCDISTGGLFVATHMLQPIGTSLTLAFALPNGHEIEVRGVVRWLRDPRDYDSDAVPGMGIQFEGVDEEDARAIREFMSLREPMFYA
jgi:uncharacterized protein (TIGR02266 family)